MNGFAYVQQFSGGEALKANGRRSALSFRVGRQPPRSDHKVLPEPIESRLVLLQALQRQPRVTLAVPFRPILIQEPLPRSPVQPSDPIQKGFRITRQTT